MCLPSIFAGCPNPQFTSYSRLFLHFIVVSISTKRYIFSSRRQILGPQLWPTFSLGTKKGLKISALLTAWHIAGSQLVVEWMNEQMNGLWWLLTMSLGGLIISAGRKGVECLNKLPGLKGFRSSGREALNVSYVILACWCSCSCVSPCPWAWVEYEKCHGLCEIACMW